MTQEFERYLLVQGFSEDEKKKARDTLEKTGVFLHNSSEFHAPPKVTTPAETPKKKTPKEGE